MSGMRRLPALMAVAAIAAAAASCSKERQSFVPSVTDPEQVPTLSTRDVFSLVSDSGYTRYRITSPLWNIYDEASEPHWSFPEGLELQQYDERLRPDAHVTCDSATYFSRKRLWRLDGHVVMVNTMRDSFVTTQLYWNQLSSTVYSDSFIHIVRQDRIIEGYGFESNQQMTRYMVHNPTAIIPVERRPGEASSATSADTAGADTAAPQPPRRRRPAPRPASQRSIDAGDAPRTGRPSPVRFQPQN